MIYVRSVESAICTACAALITNDDILADGVIRVLDGSGPMYFHLRCFELSDDDRRGRDKSTGRELIHASNTLHLLAARRHRNGRERRQSR